MKNKNESTVDSKRSIVLGLREIQRGQTMVLITFAIIAIIAGAGLAIDIGRLYYANQELQAATQAAALAGAAALSTNTATAAQNIATQYSAVAGNKNASPNLANVTMVSGYPKARCLTSTSTGVVPICTASPSGANALAVSEQATIPMQFLKVIGFKSLTLTSTAMAAARGGSGGPYNVVIIIDTTSSMNSTDDDSQCSNSRISCALTGTQVLLNALSPCAGGLTASQCGGTVSNGNVTNPVDEVSLDVFPGLAPPASNASHDYTCPTTNPPITSYNNSPVYQIVPFSSDYRTSDTATTLYTSSHVVIAAGGGSCSGVKAPGGEGTFYAGAIDAAQAQLVANARTNTKNVMILLSDGDASASASQMTNKTTPYSPTNECHQAIARAQAATAAGTTVYSVAYGATSSGCSTDSPKITPCQTMQQIASSSQTFFSDYNATGGDKSCASAARPTSSLNQIFQQIGADLTVARLIPNNTP